MTDPGSGDWPTVRLGELAEFRNGINYNKNSFGSGMKVIGVKDFQDFTKPRYAELEEINPDGVVTEANLLHEGDVLFVRSNGNRELIGRSLFVSNLPTSVTHSGFTIRTRFVSPTSDPLFYAYLFRTRIIRDGLTAHGGGTNIANLNQEILGNLRVPVPPLTVQRRIARVVAAYDDLIENNLRRIKILEEMARTIYREWFVHFRFPGHEEVSHVDSALGPIPEEWEVRVFGDIGEEIRRNVPKGELPEPTPYVGLEHIPRRSLALDAWDTVTELGSNKLAFKRGEVLFGKIRPYFHKVSVAPFDGLCSADTIVLRARRPQHYGLMVALAGSDEFVAHASATANGAKMPRANWEVLADYPIALPPDSVAMSFSEKFGRLVQLQQVLVQQITNLRATRDLLLPRLMSGRLTLPEAEEAVAGRC